MRRLRVFIAIELPDAIGRSLVRWIDLLGRSGASVKWVEPRQAHLTLKFLGDLDEADIGAICTAAARGASGIPPFALRGAGLGAFPHVTRPRTVWIGMEESGPLCILHAQLETALAELGFPKEKRKFQPHLTLGRVKQASPELAHLSHTLHAHAEARIGEWMVTEIVVMASQLDRSGPTYTRLSTIFLE